MNGLLNTTAYGPVTMSSREIAELLDVRHDNVKRTIERLAERMVITLPPLEETSFSDSAGKTQWVKEYRVGKRESYIVVAQLSPEFTAKLVDRWQELEKAAAAGEFQIPQSYAEALRLAAGQAEQIEHQNSLIAELAPKAEFHDDVASAVNSQTFMDVAKAFGTGRTRFTEWLRKRGFLMHDNRPYQRYEDYFHVVTKRRKDRQSGEVLTYNQTLVRGKGLTYLHRKWVEDHPVAPVEKGARALAALKDYRSGVH